MDFNLNEKIKSQFTKNIIIAILVCIILLLIAGVFTNKIKQVGPVEFNNEIKDSSNVKSEPKENVTNEGIIIDKMNGDILQDHSTKNVYNNPQKDSSKH